MLNQQVVENFNFIITCLIFAQYDGYIRGILCVKTQLFQGVFVTHSIIKRHYLKVSADKHCSGINFCLCSSTRTQRHYKTYVRKLETATRKKIKTKIGKKNTQETINEQNVKEQCVPYAHFTFHFLPHLLQCSVAVPLRSLK